MVKVFDFSEPRTVGMVFKKDSRLGRAGILRTTSKKAEAPSLMGKLVRDTNTNKAGVVKWEDEGRVGVDVGSESLHFANASDCETV